MNVTQARTLREAHDAYVKRIYRKPKAVLSDLYRAELADRGITILAGGPASKDDLISALVHLRYPAAKMNESVHVLYHTPEIVNEACAYCDPHPCPACGAIDTCTWDEEHGAIVNGRHVNV